MWRSPHLRPVGRGTDLMHRYCLASGLADLADLASVPQRCCAGPAFGVDSVGPVNRWCVIPLSGCAGWRCRAGRAYEAVRWCVRVPDVPGPRALPGAPGDVRSEPPALWERAGSDTESNLALALPIGQVAPVPRSLERLIDTVRSGVTSCR